jgi:hypothetical protein
MRVKKGSDNSSVSRIKFTVPLFLPYQKQDKTGGG